MLMAFSDICSTTEVAEIEKERILFKFCFNLAVNSFLHL